MEKSQQDINKEIVLEAFDTIFNKRDQSGYERYWSPDYIQHSAHILPGREGLRELIDNMPKEFRYEPGLILSENNYVMVHGRFSGMPPEFGVSCWIAVDIVRMENGLLAEHWDVLQNEATKEESQSKLPMFGNRFQEY